MAMDVTADSFDRTISARSIAKSATNNLKIPQGLASEHILISGDDSDAVDEPVTVDKQIALANRVRGIRTIFTFFNEGFLRIRQYSRNKPDRDYMLELKFLNPRPAIIRRVVRQSLWASLAMAGAAVTCGLLTGLSDLDAFTLPASIIFSAAAAVALLLFIYQSGEKILFCTATGNVPALMILTNLGCLRHGHRLIPEISNAIGNAVSNNKLGEEAYLRAEMQDHYRLRNEGIISGKACNSGTSRILSRFG